MSSLRLRLFAILVLATLIVWSAAAAWIAVGTRAKVEHVLDARLAEAAKMVDSLITSRTMDLRQAAAIGEGVANSLSYRRQLSCQIWSLHGDLVARSESAPPQALTDRSEGFSLGKVGDQTWRTYAILDEGAGVRILVGDNIEMRKRLVDSVMKGLLVPGFFMLPFMGALIWMSVGRGLAPLSDVGQKLRSRKADDFSPLGQPDGGSELRILIVALNSLLARVAAMRTTERDLIAFAAHELKTPLAGLKTQSQVALGTDDPKLREAALSRISTAVDRTSRLVHQLLDLAATEQSEAKATEAIDVLYLLDLVSADLAAGRSIRIDPGIEDPMVFAVPELLTLAIRNILENALAYSPPSGTVQFCLLRDQGVVSLVFDDDGPGIPHEELAKVRDKFFRGQHKSSVGSGLGLSIADAALTKMGARLALSNRREGGLRVVILLSAARAGRVETVDRAVIVAQTTARDALEHTS